MKRDLALGTTGSVTRVSRTRVGYARTEEFGHAQYLQFVVGYDYAVCVHVGGVANITRSRHNNKTGQSREILGMVRKLEK